MGKYGDRRSIYVRYAELDDVVDKYRAREGQHKKRIAELEAENDTRQRWLDLCSVKMQEERETIRKQAEELEAIRALAHEAIEDDDFQPAFDPSTVAQGPALLGVLQRILDAVIRSGGER